MTIDAEQDSYYDMLPKKPSRLAPRVPSELTGERLELYERIRSQRAKMMNPVTADGSLAGPWNAYVAASPGIGSLVERLASALRHESACSADLVELGILTIAARRRSEFEWFAHEKLAREAGVDEKTLSRVRRLDSDLPEATEQQRAVYKYTLELDTETRVSEATHLKALDAVGSDQALVDLVMTLGFYCKIALVLRAFDVPLPPGVSTMF